jgi:mannose-6-phosphate isomerase
VFDWNRPQTNGRVLHIEKSIAAINPQSQGQIVRQRNLGGTATSLVQCPYFNLEILSATQERDTLGMSFHALTVISGEAHISTRDSELFLHKFDTILVSAISGSYHLDGNFQILCSSVSD